MLNDPIHTVTEQLIIDIINDYNPKFLSVAPFSCFNPSLASATNECKWNDDEGVFIDVDENNAESINSLKQLTIKRFETILKDQQHVLRHFIGGFKNVVQYNGKLPLKSLDDLISGITVVTMKNVLKEIKFENIKDDEKKIFLDVLKAHWVLSAEYLNIFIQALTGSPYIPITGYDIQKPLKILVIVNGTATYNIHTCFNRMDISSYLFTDYKNSEYKATSTLYNVLSLETLKGTINILNNAK